MPRFIHDEGAGTGTGLESHLARESAQYVYATLIALAWCNALELMVLCLNTFKRYHGCYFWSLLIASFAIIPFGLGYILRLWNISFSNGFVELAIIDISWAAMVTGHSLVLWSRLHLVLHHPRVLRALLYLIIIDGVLVHSAAGTLEIVRDALPDSHTATLAFGVIERIQLVWFCLQELLLSALYIRETARMLRLDQSSISRSVLAQLLGINVVIMVLDLSVVAVQYAGYFTLQVTMKSLVYSVKLKLEYVILGRLVDVAHIRTQGEAPRFRF
ncbi:hypothetical protein EYZ11_011187 [Aspergillus tanneri]|uniref:DUF7703 domain-containing protein n=1 Tax=Aspergillus tanneri TaxID=1220188 RepID=A0A4S3J3E6_9EURO|nr:uncharacterized protein ATNIH1004_005217 [Aspergillus tanneri]KAA8649316.1 hypothetical protein ATNIH1004_005217 [Aspergillus tanneri]THC89363.1 hypothetical protein EYZ11_011187 [Aspergillus tanneri]